MDHAAACEILMSLLPFRFWSTSLFCEWVGVGVIDSFIKMSWSQNKTNWATFFHHEFHVYICLEIAPTEPALLLNLFSDSLLSGECHSWEDFTLPFFCCCLIQFLICCRLSNWYSLAMPCVEYRCNYIFSLEFLTNYEEYSYPCLS